MGYTCHNGRDQADIPELGTSVRPGVFTDARAPVRAARTRVTAASVACWDGGMDLLILGGTQWLGRTIAGEALARGHRVTCLARGEAGEPPTGVRWERADRSQAGAYDAVSAISKLIPSDFSASSARQSHHSFRRTHSGQRSRFYGR